MVGLSSGLALSSRMRRIFMAMGRTAGLGCFEHGPAHAAQPRCQAMHLGSLAGTVHAFEGDEEAASFHWEYLL